jgi:hypothetical protein
MLERGLGLWRGLRRALGRGQRRGLGLGLGQGGSHTRRGHPKPPHVVWLLHSIVLIRRSDGSHCGEGLLCRGQNLWRIVWRMNNMVRELHSALKPLGDIKYAADAMRQQCHIAIALANMATHTGLFAVVRA